MAVNIKKTVGNYVDSCWYGVVDSSGYLVGGTATAPTAGSTTGAPMLQLTGVQNFPFAPLDPDRPTQLGDGGALARFINKPTELPQADASFGAGDKTFMALVQSMLIEDIGGGSFVMGQPKNPDFEDILFLVYSPAKSQDSGSLNTSVWECMLILKANVFPKGRNDFATNALPTYSYGMVANYAEAYPWGHAFTAGDEGDTEAAILYFDWPYRPIIERWTGDNTETSFNLTKNIAEDSATNIVVFVNGTAQTWVTGAPGAGEFGITAGTPDVLVLGTAPAAAAKIVAMYGWS